MELYDYTNLLKVVDEIDLEKTKLLNIQEMQLKNKCADLEYELLNSGILEDWVQLLDFAKKCRCDGGMWYSMHQENITHRYLKDLYINNKCFIDYHNGVIKKDMGSGDCGSTEYGLSPRKSIKQGKIVWVTLNTTPRAYWDGFRTSKREYEVKIMIINTLFNTYEEYRKYNLNKLIPVVERKINENKELKESVGI